MATCSASRVLPTPPGPTTLTSRPLAIEFANLDQAWVRHSAAGPLQKVIEIARPDAVRSVLTEVLETDRKPDGALRQNNVMRYVIATK